MKILITGVGGFIGSSIADRHLLDGDTVVGIDNFSTGKRPFLRNALMNEQFQLIETDLYSGHIGVDIFKGVDVVYHMAANADIRDGLQHPNKDIEQNILVTFRVLETMREAGVKNIVFASSAAALGEPLGFPTKETTPFPRQTSLYGASKASCEGLISAYCEGFGFSAAVYRFVSVLGSRYPHGHVYDFVKKLLKDSTSLKILGDGEQKKSYLHIEDCVAAVQNISQQVFKTGSYEVFHLGTEEYVKVSESAKIITSEMNVDPQFYFTGGRSGWIGDNPFVLLDISKAKSYNWSPKYSIEVSVRETVSYLLDNQWLFND